MVTGPCRDDGENAQPRALVKPNQVLLTIVGDGNLLVRGTLDEKDLHQVRKGATTEISPVAFPDVRLEGRVQPGFRSRSRSHREV